MFESRKDKSKNKSTRQYQKDSYPNTGANQMDRALKHYSADKVIL